MIHPPLLPSPAFFTISLQYHVSPSPTVHPFHIPHLSNYYSENIPNWLEWHYHWHSLNAAARFMTYTELWNVLQEEREGVWGKCAFCREKVENAGKKNCISPSMPAWFKCLTNFSTDIVTQIQTFCCSKLLEIYFLDQHLGWYKNWLGNPQVWSHLYFFFSQLLPIQRSRFFEFSRVLLKAHVAEKSNQCFLASMCKFLHM